MATMLMRIGHYFAGVALKWQLHQIKRAKQKEPTGIGKINDQRTSTMISYEKLFLPEHEKGPGNEPQTNDPKMKSL